MPPSIELLKLIADKLVDSQYLPYILRNGWDYFPGPVKETIKHPIDMPLITSKINDNMYATMDDFRFDISSMLGNIRFFFGDDSLPATQVDKLEEDLHNVWQLEEDFDFRK